MAEQTITNEQAAFLRILSDFLNRRETSFPGDPDWRTLDAFASSHQVRGIVYKQCRRLLPKEYAASLSIGQSKEIYSYSNRVRLFGELAQELERHSIPFFTVKGLEVAALYPTPALRTMGDCDIIVHSEDRPGVNEIMLALGYENHTRTAFEWIYLKNDLEFEVHDHLLYDLPANPQSERDFTESAWDHTVATPEYGGYRRQLDHSFHFLFLILHLKKHLVNRGIGFRQFMDLAVMMQRVELDWDRIGECLEKLRLTAFFNTCCALIHRWFDISVPVAFSDISEAFYDRATQYVFSNGAFGFDNEENGEKTMLHRLHTQVGPRWWVRVCYVAEQIFLPYESIRHVHCYRFVDHRPWLLPVAWCYRLYRNRAGIFEKSRRTIANATASDEKLDAKERALKDWGL